MITFEQVEKLREKVNVSFEDAKAALEITDGDLLDAVIYLEKSGKIDRPQMGAYNTQTGGAAGGYDYEGPGHPYGPYWRKSRRGPSREGSDYEYEGPRFRDHMRNAWKKFCALVKKGNINHFVVSKENSVFLSIPITLLAIAAIFFFPATLVLLTIGLFCGCRYQFIGPDFKKDSINNIMDQAARTAENIKRSVMQESQEAQDESDKDGEVSLGDDEKQD